VSFILNETAATANGNAVDGSARSEAARGSAPQALLAVTRGIELDPTMESAPGPVAVMTARRAARIGTDGTLAAQR
jgi:hypothetical protein